jgi:hypothetical protein
MKIRNLLLGSLAVAGLSTTGAYAADLGVLTSLDVCDSLGLSGLTISSDTNCLQITGEVKYKFTWGDYRPAADGSPAAAAYGVSVPTMDPGPINFAEGDGYNDWQSRFDAWIKFVATADSDFGPAKAVLKLKEVDHYRVDGEALYGTTGNGVGSSDTGGVVLDEAYVSIGDSTVIMAGKKGSIMNKGDDEPLNWLGLFNSEAVDTGVNWGAGSELGDGGHVIQITSDLGNGVSVSAGLENINDSTAVTGAAESGVAVGVIAYKGDGISAHVTGVAGGVLDGDVEDWGVHAGFAGTFDNFKVVLAGAFGHDTDTILAGYTTAVDADYWNVLASASATFDMFTIAASFEAVDNGLGTDYGAGASVGFAVSDGVTLNLGGRWYHEDVADDDNYQIAASVAAEVTETITLTGEVGYVNDGEGTVEDLFYGKAKLAWAPGGGYTSSLTGTVTSEEGYKIETEFKKTFE